MEKIIFFYETKPMGDMRYSYLLVSENGKLSYFGQEWEKDRVLYTGEMWDIPVEKEKLLSFLRLFCQSQTHPRMFFELLKEF